MTAHERAVKSVFLRDGFVQTRDDGEIAVFLDGGTSPIRNDSLKRLVGIRRLSELDASDTLVTDDGLAHLSALGDDLKVLRLDRCDGITDKSLRHIQRLTNLELLSIRETLLTESAIERLKKSLPQCKVVHKR